MIGLTAYVLKEINLNDHIIPIVPHRSKYLWIKKHKSEQICQWVISPSTSIQLWLDMTLWLLHSHCVTLAKIKILNCNNHSTIEVQMCALLKKIFKRFKSIWPNKDFILPNKVGLLYWLFFLENWLWTILFQTSVVSVTIVTTVYLLDSCIAVDLGQLIT